MLLELKDKIKFLREEKGLTQKQLAKIFGFAESTIGCYETGKRHPDYNLLKRLADFFNCSTDYLLCRTDKRNATVTEVELININGKRFSKEEIEEKIRFAEQVEEALKKAKWKPEKS